MAQKGKKAALKRFLLREIRGCNRNPTRAAIQRFGVSRQYVSTMLGELRREGWASAEGSTRRRAYHLEFIKDSREIPTSIPEDRVWTEFVRQTVEDLPANVQQILQYGVTEMINNVIDHSGADSYALQVRKNPVLVIVTIGDDGVGVFEKLRDHFGLVDSEHAALELSKGKLTTDPEKHTGEGIFFTSRMVDEFQLLSDHIELVTEHADKAWVIRRTERLPGTRVQLHVHADTDRAPVDVFREYTAGADDPSFSITHVPISLVEIGESNLISRSQAKRLMARLDAFARVELDFTGIASIGQGFADEVFRVWADAHPEVELEPVLANADVQLMIDRARGRSRTAERP